MEVTLPWDLFLSLIRPVYHQPCGKDGRPPLPLEVMLRIHLLQQWFTLSDPLMEEMLIEQGLLRKQGTILDATMINAPSSTKIKLGESDPEMHSAAKGKQWFHC